MLRVGEIIVTVYGIGRVLDLKNEKYHVLIEFPQDNRHSYETWITNDEIRYSLTDLKSSNDEDIPPRITKPKIKKQKSKYSYGTWKNVWR